MKTVKNLIFSYKVKKTKKYINSILTSTFYSISHNREQIFNDLFYFKRAFDIALNQLQHSTTTAKCAIVYLNFMCCYCDYICIAQSKCSSLTISP